MPPHRVAAVLRTLAPNSIPRLSPPRATHPQLSPWPSFSLVAAATTAARSHTPRTPRFSTKLSRRASGHADPPLPLYHRHHYHRPHHHQHHHSYYHYCTPVAITFGASTFTSSNSTMCCLRRVSAELPSSFQIQPPIPPPPPPPFSLLSFRFSASPAQRVPPFPSHISCALPSPLLLQVSSNFFHPTPPLEPTTMLPRHTLYISRARETSSTLLPPPFSFSLLLASYPGDAHYVLTYAPRRPSTKLQSELWSNATHSQCDPIINHFNRPYVCYK